MYKHFHKIIGRLKAALDQCRRKPYAVFVAGLTIICVLFHASSLKEPNIGTHVAQRQLFVSVSENNTYVYNETLEREPNVVSQMSGQQSFPLKSQPGKKKHIYLFDIHHGGLRQQASLVDMETCPNKDCILQFIDSATPSAKEMAKADAVLFQGGRLPEKPPRRRDANQVYVFLNVESPLHLHFNNSYVKKPWYGAFNWTMTYRLDSDIPYKYGAVVKRQAWQRTHKNYDVIFARKTKKIAWLVSDCPTESHREKYVKELRKFIPVDVYGDCGPFKNCSRSDRGCIPKIVNDYMFYLSFENSICRDYVTEKVFNWFDLDIISVVRGGMTYDKILPAGTYIDSSDFQNPRALGEYLQRVSRNGTLYGQYLRTKSNYIVSTQKEEHKNAYCKLCYKLHNLDRYRKHYTYMSKWWYSGKCVIHPTDIMK